MGLSEMYQLFEDIARKARIGMTKHDEQQARQLLQQIALMAAPFVVH